MPKTFLRNNACTGADSSKAEIIIVLCTFVHWTVRLLYTVFLIVSCSRTCIICQNKTLLSRPSGIPSRTALLPKPIAAHLQGTSTRTGFSNFVNYHSLGCFIRKHAALLHCNMLQLPYITSRLIQYVPQVQVHVDNTILIDWPTS
jgi:hypothetical protein